MELADVQPLNEMDHTKLMTRAIELSAISREKGNKPFGALLADFDGNILLEAENTEYTDNDFTSHAETNLLSMASRKYSVAELSKTIMYASCEPCAMCAGAAFFTGVPNVVFGLSCEGLEKAWGSPSENPKARALEMTCRQVLDSTRAYPNQVVGPMMEKEAAVPHAGFTFPTK